MNPKVSIRSRRRREVNDVYSDIRTRMIFMRESTEERYTETRNKISSFESVSRYTIQIPSKLTNTRYFPSEKIWIRKDFLR